MRTNDPDKPRLTIFDQVGPNYIEKAKQTPQKIRNMRKKLKFKLHREQ